MQSIKTEKVSKDLFARNATMKMKFVLHKTIFKKHYTLKTAAICKVVCTADTSPSPSPNI